MLRTIPQYISAMSDTYGLTKSIGVIDICTKPNGEPDYRIGNNSIIFRIRHEGRNKMLKCYTRDKRNLRRIYGAKCLREELYIHTLDDQGEWVDVVLDDWIEGKTLYQTILDRIGSNSSLRSVAVEFDRLAASLLTEEWAHGDLKPENIIITPEGAMHLIDFDAMFRPEFAGEPSEEIGTAAYQHPARNTDYFNKSIDDYPIALISTALHALALDPSLAERYDIGESLLMHPREIARGAKTALDEILPLFARQGYALHYRIAQLLRSVTPKLHNLPTLMQYATMEGDTACSTTEEVPILDNLNGLWGYRRGDKFVIPPLYDCGFEFCEGVAAVCIGGYWHYIDPCGEVVLRCPQYDAVKSFHNGKATVIERGRRKQIDLNGKELQYP